ncbi:hypothetical protein ALC62_09652 [Cyphomyrmex costatus]|uniref:Uncharacterized protein n=1 Tax=Cyphomyrmex costatus TaxID=456900 RepID=A0A151IF69_9HYME|nr:hypothetical protein ALC62_09652 [Cyphomyrmex costatus]
MGQSLNNRPRSMSTESLRNIILNRELRRSKSYTVLDKALKRDRNYNIKRDQFSFPVKNTVKTNYNAEIETIFPPLETLSLSKLSAVSNRKDDSTKEHDSVNIEMSSKDELNPSELKTFLQSLVDPEPLVESSAQQRLLRRLSTHYYDSPKVFTEGLLTIIEESVINNDSCAQSQYPEFSLFRFNEELRKMCKFLEDETAPEWPGSPGMSTSFCAKRKSQGLNDLLRKSLGVLSPDKDLHFTMPVSSPCNIKSPKKAYRRISKNISYNTKNVFNDSTNTFESLEAMCKNLYPDQDCTVPAKEKNLLQSPLQNMVKILRTCENQMASLENSPNIHERVKKAGTCTSDSAYQRNKLLEEQNLEHRLLLNEKYDRTDSERVPDILWQTEHGKCQEMIEQNDFENTVMYEIAKKRQKCLDTVKVVMEIDETFKPLEQIHLNINDSSSIEDDKFMQTLISVKQYQDYLEKYKSLLGLFHRTKLNTCTPCDRQAVQDKKIDKQSKVKAVQGKKLSVVLNDKQILKIPSPRKKSISPSTKCSTNVVSKPRLFITPGKTPFNRNCKLKRTYFPNLLPENKQNKHVSSQAKSIYRQMGNYDHVVSPVGAYIKGTESRLTKNDQPKRILTQSPNSKVKLQSSSKPKKKLTGTTVGDENVANNFLHPKMHYNYPSSSHIVCNIIRISKI